MKKYILLFVGCVICLIFFHGCRNSDNQPNEKKFLAGKWLLQTLNGEEVNIEKAGSEVPYFYFNLMENKVSGNTGCNDLDGKISITETEITFSSMAMSKIYCSEAKYEYEIVKFFFKLEPVKYKIEDNILIFTRYEKVIMTCKKL